MHSENDNVDLTPGTALLTALAESNLGWEKSAAEFIDNAFDANASQVKLSFDARANGELRKLEVFDDGDGTDDLVKIVSLGRRKNHKTTKLGRYGVGAKDALLWIGGIESTVTVVSFRGGVKRRLELEWAKMVRSNSWSVPPVMETKPEIGDKGTRISVLGVRRQINAATWKRFVDKLGYLYAPAIHSNKQILVRAPFKGSEIEPVKAWRLPEFEPEKSIDTEISVNGKKARVIFGIVKRGTRHSNDGITYASGFRVIRPASSLGCGDYSTANVAGYVVLRDGWVLSKNKDDISVESDLLYDAVLRVCKPLLEEAEALTHTLEMDGLQSSVESALNQMVFPNAGKDAKAVRERGTDTGTSEPTGTGGKHKRAKKEQKGRTFGARRISSLRVQFVDFDEQSESVGRLDDTGLVTLNRSHPFVSGHIKSKNTNGIASLAISILCSSTVFTQQCELQFDGDDAASRFCHLFGHLTMRNATFDGAPIVGVPQDESQVSDQAAQ